MVSLSEAVRRFIAPGQTIYLGAAHGRPNALVRELVRQWWGKRPEWYPVPQTLVGPDVLSGGLSIQNWSMLTLPLRVLAGAMGVPFLPTRSLLGSSMEEDNARDGVPAACTA